MTRQRRSTTTPPVPGTVFVTEVLWAPGGDNAEPFRQGVRAQQAALAAHYRPGKTITVKAPHTMLEVVPDQGAAETLHARGSGTQLGRSEVLSPESRWAVDSMPPCLWFIDWGRGHRVLLHDEKALGFVESGGQAGPQVLRVVGP